MLVLSTILLSQGEISRMTNKDGAVAPSPVM